MVFLNKLSNLYIKFLLKKRNKQNEKSVFFKSSTTKHSMTSYCTLKLSAETEMKKKEINDRLKHLLKKYMNSPEKLLQYMQLKGYKVYKFKDAAKLLYNLGEEEGFITPQKGYKAFILNLIIGLLFEQKLKISFSTKEMFVFNVGTTEIYTIARALHKYNGFKNSLPGFDEKSQEIFKKVYNNSKRSLSMLNECTIKDMYACKEAIARDLESINFTIELSVEYERSKKVLAKMKETNSAEV